MSTRSALIDSQDYVMRLEIVDGRYRASTGSALVTETGSVCEGFELRARNARQIERIGRQIRKIAIADRLLTAIAGAAIARTAEGGVEAIQIAPGWYARTPSYEWDSKILQLAGRIVRSASPTMIGSKNEKGMAA